MTRWSLGPLGDLIWEIFPELRPAIKEELCERIDVAINLDEPLRSLENYEFFVHVIGPRILQAMDEEREGPTDVARLAALIRRGYAYDGPDAAFVRIAIEDYLLEGLSTPYGVRRMLQVDPELARRHWPNTVESFQEEKMPD